MPFRFNEITIAGVPASPKKYNTVSNGVYKGITTKWGYGLPGTKHVYIYIHSAVMAVHIKKKLTHVTLTQFYPKRPS